VVFYALLGKCYLIIAGELVVVFVGFVMGAIFYKKMIAL